VTIKEPSPHCLMLQHLPRRSYRETEAREKAALPQAADGTTLSWDSQNHRIVGVGRDLRGSSSPTLLPKQGHLQQAAEDLVQARGRAVPQPAQAATGMRRVGGQGIMALGPPAR